MQISSSNIKLKCSAGDWQEAIRKGGELLVASGFATGRYVDAMVEAVREHGPYIVLTPGVAIPHARCESGAIGTGVSLITLKEPVDFLDSENNPVNIVICLAAADKTAHLDLLKDLSLLIGSEENVTLLKEANDVAEVLTLLNELSSERMVQ